MVIRGVLGAGSQYCCWNSDSSLVALSSDFYQAVMVFDVHRKQQVCLLLLLHHPRSIVCCCCYLTQEALCFAIDVL